MAYNQPLPPGAVSAEQYEYTMTNFRIAHEKVQQQRQQLEEQERQVAQLRSRIALLEGNGQQSESQANTVDDFSIRNAASKLDRLINRWAADIVRSPPVPLPEISRSVLQDLLGANTNTPFDQASPIVVQSLLRHAIAETISEGIINCLVVCNSSEANTHFTRVHEHLFTRDPLIACVWRRQTFSAAVEACTLDICTNMFTEHIPTLTDTLNDKLLSPSGGVAILQSAFEFSRMLHGSNSNATDAMDAFYRAYVPEIGSGLDPAQVELIRRCVLSESRQMDRVGATIFPGLVKVTKNAVGASDNVQTVVRRAQVICECALRGGAIATNVNSP